MRHILIRTDSLQHNWKLSMSVCSYFTLYISVQMMRRKCWWHRMGRTQLRLCNGWHLTVSEQSDLLSARPSQLEAGWCLNCCDNISDNCRNDSCDVSHVSGLICPDKVRILGPDVRSDTPSSVTPCHGVIRDFFFRLFYFLNYLLRVLHKKRNGSSWDEAMLIVTLHLHFKQFLPHQSPYLVFSDPL